MTITSVILMVVMTATAFMIVGLWRKRPILAFVLAALILVFPLPLIGMVKTFQAMMIYGTGDPQLMAGGIAQAMMSTSLTVPIGLPLLALFQWSVRRLTKSRSSKADVENTFL